MQEYEFYEIGMIIFPCVSPLHPILLKITLTHQIIYGLYLFVIDMQFIEECEPLCHYPS
jgi:hypothetical protein